VFEILVNVQNNIYPEVKRTLNAFTLLILSSVARHISAHLFSLRNIKSLSIGGLFC